MASGRRPTTALVLTSLLCLYHAPSCVLSLSFTLDFSDPTAGSSIVVSGDALVSPPALQLTKNSWASYRSSSAGGGPAVVTVEFDAFPNHVGIDISSANSTASAHTTATWPGKNLTTSSVMEATVKYHNDSRMLAVALLIDGALYQVSATVDLRRNLPEEVAIGFSAGMHRILLWSFGSTLPESKQEASPQLAEPPLPASSYDHKKIALVLLFLGTITTSGWRWMDGSDLPHSTMDEALDSWEVLDGRRIALAIFKVTSPSKYRLVWIKGCDIISTNH
ncbi:Lectin [Triticum urartu]|uniref:Lectin n=1 Tax=Triticum urartu TaxID=4572 RepID=M7ZYS9_TRIUA|nr:Lectin [Triticum urartu]